MPSAWLTVARIVKTQGRRGEVAAEILTDFPQRLAQRRRVWLWDGAGEPQPVEIETLWPHKRYLVFKFAGADSISQAEELLGREVQIPREEAAALGDSEFYLEELVGCRVVEQASGRELGRVRELLRTGGADLLAVDTSDGKELLIPFVEEFCLRVDAGRKLIEVNLPDDLQHLNE